MYPAEPVVSLASVMKTPFSANQTGPWAFRLGSEIVNESSPRMNRT